MDKKAAVTKHLFLRQRTAGDCDARVGTRRESCRCRLAAMSFEFVSAHMQTYKYWRLPCKKTRDRVGSSKYSVNKTLPMLVLKRWPHCCPLWKGCKDKEQGSKLPKYFLNEKAHRWSWCRDEGYGRVPSIKIERCHYQKKSSVWRYTGSEKMMLADGGSIRNWEAWAWGPFVLNPFGFRDVWWMPNINIPFKQMDLASTYQILRAPNMAFMELCWVFSISLFCVLLLKLYKLSIGEFKYGDTKAIPTKQQWWLRDRKCPTEID